MLYLGALTLGQKFADTRTREVIPLANSVATGVNFVTLKCSKLEDKGMQFPSRVKISSGVLGRVCYDVRKRQVELQQVSNQGGSGNNMLALVDPYSVVR